MSLFKITFLPFERKLDSILKYLYHEEALLNYRVSTQKFLNGNTELKLSENESTYFLNLLIDEGLIIRKNNLQADNRTNRFADYSLTVKGITLKRRGGFVRAKLISFFSQFLLFVGGFIALISALFTIVDLCIKYFNKQSTPTPVVTKIVNENRTTNYYKYESQDTCKYKSVK